jgi:type IV pilus assembly protein PilO
MAKSFSLPSSLKLTGKIPGRIPAKFKDPRVVVRIVLGVLVTANLVAALVVFRPWGGSAEDLMRQQQQLRQQLTQAEARVAKSKVVVAKVEQARQEGDEFLAKYVTERRTTMSTVKEELNRIAQDAGVTPKGDSINLEPVEGSDTLIQMTIAEVYEGQYAQIAKLVNLLDKSQRFLIISNMVATPKANSNVLTVSLRLDTFVRSAPGDES